MKYALGTGPVTNIRLRCGWVDGQAPRDRVRREPENFRVCTAHYFRQISARDHGRRA
jgi:hypothetical protein